MTARKLLINLNFVADGRSAHLRGHWAMLACWFVLATFGTAMAQVTHIYANSWQENNFQDPTNPGCSIGGDGSVAGSRIILGASQRKPSPMNLVIRRTAWAIPAGTVVHVRAVFSDDAAVTLNGVGHGQEVDVDLDDATVPVWVHLLTASARMQLFFEGNEAAYPWSFDLTGTSKVVDAMGDCFKEHNIQGLPQPFSRVLAAQGTPQAGSAAAAPTLGYAPASPPTSSQDCRSIQSALERLQCYDRAGSGPVAPPVRPQVVAPPATSPAPAPASEATSGQSGLGCDKNWRACKDNSDLINHSEEAVIDAQTRCEIATEHTAKYGTPKLPGFWAGGSFNRFHVGDDYPRTGIVTLIEPEAQFQNAFSAMVHSTVVCRYDLNSGSVLGVDVAPND